LSVANLNGSGYAGKTTPRWGKRLGGNSNGSEMLVLTRKANQSIMIGDEIEVSVLAVSRDKIRLGISAPREVPVFRKEVYLSIKHGQAQALAGEADAALEALKRSE
jgi:carbon storage regulator